MQIVTPLQRSIRLGAAGSVVRSAEHRRGHADSVEQGRRTSGRARRRRQRAPEIRRVLPGLPRSRRARRSPRAIGHARAYEEERQRAEALAEIDRAKTAFFSNVSHEFRTPLTLMVGPLEDVLADAATPLPPVHRERQEIAHRNALRLLRLVNTLLDFSRIEAGRIDASYEPTDLAA